MIVVFYLPISGKFASTGHWSFAASVERNGQCPLKLKRNKTKQNKVSQKETKKIVKKLLFEAKGKRQSGTKSKCVPLCINLAGAKWSSWIASGPHQAAPILRDLQENHQPPLLKGHSLPSPPRLPPQLLLGQWGPYLRKHCGPWVTTSGVCSWSPAPPSLPGWSSPSLRPPSSASSTGAPS